MAVIVGGKLVPVQPGTWTTTSTDWLPDLPITGTVVYQHITPPSNGSWHVSQVATEITASGAVAGTAYTLAIVVISGDDQTLRDVLAVKLFSSVDGKAD